MAKIADMQEVSLDLLKPYERNAKIHGEEQIEKLMDSIREFGFLSPCLVERDTFNLIAGHGRVEAAKRLGMEKVPCVFVEDITEAQRRAYILADNRLSELGEWDMDLVNFELKGLDELDFDISLTGFDLELATPEVEEDDFEEHEHSEPRAKRGDIFQLGEHRLMCGDSTSHDDVQMLMGGALADMVFTDPPYGVSYTDKNEFLNSIDKPLCVVDAIQNDDMPPEDMHELWVAAFKNLYDFTKEKMSYYITAPQGGDLLLLLQAVRESGFALKHQIIWNKNNHVLGRCDYNYKHEPIVYGWKLTGTHEFSGNGSMKTSVWDVDKPLRSDLHPTMKPVELISNAILNSSKTGQIVLDLFGGSGSTMIAAEQTGRKCYMMELEPHYIDVIIDRWEDYTGGKAVRLNG